METSDPSAQCRGKVEHVPTLQPPRRKADVYHKRTEAWLRPSKPPSCLGRPCVALPDPRALNPAVSLRTAYGGILLHAVVSFCGREEAFPVLGFSAFGGFIYTPGGGLHAPPPEGPGNLPERWKDKDSFDETACPSEDPVRALYTHTCTRTIHTHKHTYHMHIYIHAHTYTTCTCAHAHTYSLCTHRVQSQFGYISRPCK